MKQNQSSSDTSPAPNAAVETTPPSTPMDTPSVSDVVIIQGQEMVQYRLPLDE